jgi:ABC-type proline/glycine betaine transport system permease subunit
MKKNQNILVCFSKMVLTSVVCVNGLGQLLTLAHITLVLTQHFKTQFVEPGEEGTAKPHTCERRV